MRVAIVVTAALLALGLAACPRPGTSAEPSPAPAAPSSSAWGPGDPDHTTEIGPSISDGGAPTGDEVAACASIATAGCPEGRPATGTCAGYLAAMIALHANIDLGCLRGAGSPAAVRACEQKPGMLPIRCAVDAGAP